MRTLAAAALAVAALVHAPALMAQTAVKFTNDWAFDGTTAYIVHTAEKGYFAAEGLAVSIDRGFGAGDVIKKVGSGAYPVGIGDVTALIEYNARNSDLPLVAIMIVYDKAAYSIVTLVDKNIRSLGDLAGRKVGSIPSETGIRLLPIVARLNNIDIGKIEVQSVNPQLRDTLLVRGEVDAVTGFYSTAVLNLERLGVPEAKQRIFKYTDFGLDIYGSAIVTSAAYAKENPGAAAAFVKALARGLQDSIRDPAAAIASLKKREPLTEEDLELKRLKLVLGNLVVTPYTKANGFGGIDTARLAKQIDLVTQQFELPAKPAPDIVFTSQFLPPASARAVP